jgi:hypothetical protein
MLPLARLLDIRFARPIVIVLYKAYKAPLISSVVSSCASSNCFARYVAGEEVAGDEDARKPMLAQLFDDLDPVQV